MKTRIDPETFGAFTGIAGALLLALNNPGAGKIGWLCFLASNFFWMVFAARGNFRKLFWQQVAFGCTSLLGIWNSYTTGLNIRDLIHSINL